MAVSAARKAAFKILMAMERGDSHSDELLRADAVSALTSADRNLATTLVLGVLRWQMVLDEAIKPLLKRPAAKLDVEIRVALRMGAFQLLYLDRVPAHAAIDESVQLAKQAGHKFASGMVNAVLRKLSTDRSERDPFMVLEGDFTAAFPGWLTARWERAFGVNAAFAICKHGQQPPRTSVRLTDAGVEDELALAGVRLEPGWLLTAVRTVASGDVTATEAFRAGRVRIQDEGSQLVGEIAACVAADARKVHADGGRVLDACAAPGGKTLILAERLTGARIVACDVSPARHAALRERLAACGDRVECRLADAAAMTEEDAFDVVLVDAPCSGTGTLGRNPEIRYRLKEEELARQAERQTAILRAALRMVKADGRVVYSTCSLEPEENEGVLAQVAGAPVDVRAYLDAMRGAGILTETGAQELAKCVTAEGALRLMPGVLGTDGFFVAVMKRG